MNQRQRRATAARRRSPQRDQHETFLIDSLAAGGAGVGSLDDGLRVFVPGTALGERVLAAVQRHNKPARGRLLQVLEPSPDRRTPPCPYIATCGGCDFMHIAERAQQAAHAEIVRAAVAHAVGLSPPPVRVHSAPEPFAYRTRARLFARADRGRVRVGYRIAASHALAEVATCVVLAPSIAPALSDLPDVLAASSGEGDIQIARGHGGLLTVDVVWRGELAASVWSAIDRRVADGRWAGARIRLDGATTPATFGDPRPVLDGADGEPLVVAAGSFAQPSDLGATVLARRVLELSRECPDKPSDDDSPSLGVVVELFAGSGTFSVLLARAASAFSAVESDEKAIAAARLNLASRGLSGKISQGDADAPRIASNVDVVVLDPPRAGASGAASAIAASRVSRVVYVSCDPATLARDLALLVRGGYCLTHLETVELFPQTSHVETLARLVRDPTRARRDALGYSVDR